MNEFTQQFLVESRELAEQVSADLLHLEERTDDPEALNRTFRGFHTLKGAAGIMEYAVMEQLLHRAEDVLQDLRAGRRTVTPALIDALLACVGQLVRWFDVIERTDAMPSDASKDADRVGAALAPMETAPAAPVRPDSWRNELLEWARAQEGVAIDKASTVLRYQPDTDCFFRGEDPVARVSEISGLLALRLLPAEPWPAPEDLQPFVCNLIIEAVLSASKADVEAALERAGGRIEVVELVPSGAATAQSAARTILEEQIRFLQATTDADSVAGRAGAAGRVAANVLRAQGLSAADVDVAVASGNPGRLVSAIQSVLGGEARGQAHGGAGGDGPVRDAAGGTIRVEVEKVDHIVNLTGELLVAKNALGHWARLAAEGGDPKAIATGLKVQYEVFDRHIADLQRSVFDLRVLPLERVFSRFPRLVRETAAALGKQVEFSTEGGDTKADKAVVEALFEPLLHVIRNAIDHGVELPQQRASAGKPVASGIALRAWREGDHVLVDVSDDGQGVDVATVRRLAVARHVADEAAIAEMSDDQAVDLIFAPGFSTAKAVTDLSGRGVGMGAVRAAIERIGGEVSLINRPGQGLTVRLVLPFTVMLTRVMTVYAGGQTFGVPFDAIIETVRIPRASIKPLGAGRAFVLRDETIPVVDLAQSLGLEAAAARGDACIVVVGAGGKRAGLEIDRPGERMDMMLKPVEGVLSGMRAIAGTSLLGDGQVLIVLDLKALLE